MTFLVAVVIVKNALIRKVEKSLEKFLDPDSDSVADDLRNVIGSSLSKATVVIKFSRRSV